jgi:hypothetical protein
VVFTGTWGVLNGGIRLLAENRPGEVGLGAHGYGDGAVELTGFDAAHRLFAGLAAAPRPLADGGHWSVLDSYVGPYLARLAVGGDARGIGAAYDYRSADSLHLLLSAGAASPYVGPGYGWTADGERLFLNAVAWARDAKQPIAAAPTLETTAGRLVAADSIPVSGTAEFRSQVTVRRAGAAIGEAAPDRAGAYEADAQLAEGINTLTATARNFAGESMPSAPLTVTRDTTGPSLEWTPGDRSGTFERDLLVHGTVADVHAGVDEVRVNGELAWILAGNRFLASVRLAEGENAISVVARDRLGNQTTHTRRVAHFRYSTEWDVHGERGRGELEAELLIRDRNGRRIEVDSAWIELLDGDGDAVASVAARESGGRYRARLGRPDPGRYRLRARLVEAGFAITDDGPSVERRR